ncbi:hypothetical protein AN477_18360 [Alicyclobacillus ferrooxydans]|uniref:Preprotein translocase subunit YajC n=2 Tax=Alicyclobacillus ferrooxydans TaxID=471514 RepID=A0A0N8PNS7_9BACL|nr:hypothetical protein AN477_18360 [Alicyclobacillus ferrooxydans]
MILPQRRQAKQRTAMMKQLGPGAKVVTTSGIYGNVVEIADDRVFVTIAPDVEIELDPRAILRVVEAAPVQAEYVEEPDDAHGHVEEPDDEVQKDEQL